MTENQHKNERLELSKVNGYWCKYIKVVGYKKHRRFYFGEVSKVSYLDALDRYRFELPFLKANRDPYSTPKEASTVGDLEREFLAKQNEKLEAKKLSAVTMRDYCSIVSIVVETFGRTRPLLSLVAEDFEQLKKAISFNKKGEPYSVNSFNRKVGYLQTLFRFAVVDNRLIDRNFPMQSIIRRVPKKETRKHRAESARRLLTAEEIRLLLSRANNNERAMIFLAINGGFNNSDIAQLKITQFDPVPEILEYERRKTYVARMTPLWDKTRAAIDIVLKHRPLCVHDRLFWKPTTKHFYGDYSKHCNGISKMFSKLLDNCGINAPGKNFGALRTTFADVGSQVEDDLAVKALMGHEDGSTLYSSYARANYVPRLEKVTNYIYQWLFK